MLTIRRRWCPSYLSDVMTGAVAAASTCDLISGPPGAGRSARRWAARALSRVIRRTDPAAPALRRTRSLCRWASVLGCYRARPSPVPRRSAAAPGCSSPSADAGGPRLVPTLRSARFEPTPARGSGAIRRAARARRDGDRPDLEPTTDGAPRRLDPATDAQSALCGVRSRPDAGGDDALCAASGRGMPPGLAAASVGLGRTRVVEHAVPPPPTCPAQLLRSGRTRSHVASAVRRLFRL